MKLKIPLAFSTTLLFAWLGLVFVADRADGPIRHPATAEDLALATSTEALRFAVVSREASTSREVALVVASPEGDRFLPLASALSELGEETSSFVSSLALVSNMERAQLQIRERQGELRNFDTLSMEEVRLRPFFEIPTKVLHGAQSAGHYRNAKRAAVKRTLPGLTKWVLNPFNYMTGDGFYRVNPAKMPFDFFHGNNVGLYSTEDDVPLVHGTTELDIEAELGVVIGRSGRSIAPEEVRAYVAGYILFNDFTDRAEQARERAEVYTGYNTSKYLTGIGPYLVTEVDPSRFTATVRVNGVEQLTASNDEIVDFMALPDQIAEYSKYFLGLLDHLYPAEPRRRLGGDVTPAEWAVPDELQQNDLKNGAEGRVAELIAAEGGKEPALR